MCRLKETAVPPVHSGHRELPTWCNSNASDGTKSTVLHAFSSSAEAKMRLQQSELNRSGGYFPNFLFFSAKFCLCAYMDSVCLLSCDKGTSLSWTSECLFVKNKDCGIHPPSLTLNSPSEEISSQPVDSGNHSSNQQTFEWTYEHVNVGLGTSLFISSLVASTSPYPQLQHQLPKLNCNVQISYE